MKPPSAPFPLPRVTSPLYDISRTNETQCVTISFSFSCAWIVSRLPRNWTISRNNNRYVIFDDRWFIVVHQLLHRISHSIENQRERERERGKEKLHATIVQKNLSLKMTMSPNPMRLQRNFDWNAIPLEAFFVHATWVSLHECVHQTGTRYVHTRAGPRRWMGSTKQTASQSNRSCQSKMHRKIASTRELTLKYRPPKLHPRFLSV